MKNKQFQLKDAWAKTWAIPTSVYTSLLIYISWTDWKIPFETIIRTIAIIATRT